ncbi:MAG: hypothetical protein ACWA40_02590 [Planktomarina sp.]
MSIDPKIPQKDRDIALRGEFRSYIILLREEIARITDGLPYDTASESKDLRWLIKDLEKTRKELLSLEKRISDEEDADPTQHFDFDAVRAAVGGRLDRLRRSYSPKDVSG